MSFCTSYLISHHPCSRHSHITFYIPTYFLYIPLLRQSKQSWLETLLGSGWGRNWVPYGDKKLEENPTFYPFCSCRAVSQIAIHNQLQFSFSLLCDMPHTHISHFSSTPYSLLNGFFLEYFMALCTNLFLCFWFVYILYSSFISVVWTMRPCPSTQIDSNPP